ncbi:MAG: hypothetical protein ACKOB8_07725 [Mycobacterium sp.]
MSKSSSGGGAGAFVAIMVLLWVVVTFFWWLVAAACLVALIYGVRAIVRIDRRNRERYAAYCAAVCARADQQHRWVLRGDERGIYGPEGARLMRAIR